MNAPQVTRLLTTPVKGFALHSVSTVSVDANGAVGDRDFFMVDDNDRLVSITKIGTFASWTAHHDDEASSLSIESRDGQRLQGAISLGAEVAGQFFDDRVVTGNIVEGQWREWLSEIAGRPLRLVKASQPGGAFDEHAVTMLGEASVAELGKHAPDGELDPRRFRMLIGFNSTTPYEEDTWNGQTLTVGTAKLRVRGPVPRCNATTRNPDTGDKDVKTLNLITEHRGMQPNDYGEGLNLGVYADVLTPGKLSVGDTLLLSTSS